MENFNFHQISPSAVFLINDLAGSIFSPFRRTALIPSLLFNAAPPLHRLIAQSLVNLFYVTGILYFAQLATFRLTRFQLLLKTPSHSRLLSFSLSFVFTYSPSPPPPHPHHAMSTFLRLPTFHIHHLCRTFNLCAFLQLS